MIDSFASVAALASRVVVIPVAVDDEPTTWVATIRAICPRFDNVYTRNPWVESHFQFWGIANSTELLAGNLLSGSYVRSRIAEGGDWRELVPATVASLIEQFNGQERVRALLQGSEYRLGADVSASEHCIERGITDHESR